MRTYDCPVDGIPKHERRKRDRKPADERIERLFNGFHNLRGDAQERNDDYSVGYITAMMNALADTASGLQQSKDFYKRRVDLLQRQQSRMRDPERTIVCDILANGDLMLDPKGTRYGLPPELDAVEGDVLPPIGSDVLITHGRDDGHHPCMVVGYYVWPALSGDKWMQRVYVRVLYKGTHVLNARMLHQVWRPDGTAFLPNVDPLPKKT